ncbi:MAG: hypothetical protein IKC65_03405, partial [Lentisphaeria bacterium]|nr:hypothetical protein [Lentisphaeria bacterium]
MKNGFEHSNKNISPALPAFTLIELLVKRSRLCGNRVDCNEGGYSPVHGQVKQYCFTLIELLVVTAQHCRDFFRGFICTDQYGCVR